MNALERFLKYAAYSTASAEGVQSSPTTERQFALARELARELAGLGAPDAVCTDKCCVYANFPATPGLEGARAVGFIAHMDTSPDFCGEGVRPKVIPGYDGGDVELGCGRVLRVSEQPHLASLRGRTLVTTSGDTLLGADDKAGVAEIMTMAERLAAMPHGPVSVCFTPDEEVGRGTAGFDFELFKAGCAYTVDGGQEGEISWENFNASSAVVSFKGVNVHPGDATNVMVNAGLAAVEFASRLPEAETPRLTSGRQGFYHLTGIEGEVGSARLSYILRDHDEAVLRGREEKIRSVAGELNAKYARRHGERGDNPGLQEHGPEAAPRAPVHDRRGPRGHTRGGRRARVQEQPRRHGRGGALMARPALPQPRHGRLRLPRPLRAHNRRGHGHMRRNTLRPRENLRRNVRY